MSLGTGHCGALRRGPVGGLGAELGHPPSSIHQGSQTHIGLVKNELWAGGGLGAPRAPPPPPEWGEGKEKGLQGT